MLSRIGYVLAALVVVAVALACLAWTALEPPALPVPPRGVVVIKDVTLVNPGLGRSAHVDITVRNGVIATIEPTTARASRSDIRCPGCFALPGLIDMDARFPVNARIGTDRSAAMVYLRHGVTTLRVTDPLTRDVVALRDAVSLGRVPGPRILPCAGANVRGGERASCGADLNLPDSSTPNADLSAITRTAVEQHAAYTPLLNPANRALVQSLFKAGVPIYAGSGRVGGWDLKHQMFQLSQMGATPEAVLVTATTSPGRFWSDATYGQIAIGLPADIVLYRSDPTVSLGNLETEETIVADGRVYSERELKTWCERYRRHFGGWLYQMMMFGRLHAPYVEGMKPVD